MIKSGDVVKLKQDSRSYPFLVRASSYMVRDVKDSSLRLAGQISYMASKEFEKVEKDNG